MSAVSPTNLPVDHLPANGDYTVGNRISIIHGGAEYFDLLESLIDNACYNIQLQYYIFNDDLVGYRIGNALIRASERGVDVYVLIDGYESRSLSGAFIQMLVTSNVQVERFEPLFRSRKFYIGRRLHHKVAVFDAEKAIVGGVNIADRYMDYDHLPAWLDMALYMEGQAGAELYDICCRMWKDAVKRNIRPFSRASPQPASMLPFFRQHDKCSVRIRRNDWLKGKNQIWKSYFEMFNQSSESIIVMCSYFLPDRTYMQQMKKAIGRGVSIKVILAGISDVMVAKHAERYLYDWMLRNGIEIYEYKGSVLHAKVAVRDRKWMTIGSYNVNNISAYASIELNADVRNKPFVAKVQDELERIATEECDRVTAATFRTTQNIFRQMWQWSCYQIIRIVLYLATFYFRKEV